MAIMTTESKFALFLGFFSELVSRLFLYLPPSSIWLTTTIYHAKAHWRQTYFRPNKPLPINAGSNHSRLPITPRQPFKRTIINFIVSCLFLGIPYIFYDRTTRLSTRIVDEESGLRYAITPTLVIGACTSLAVRTNYPFLPPLLSKPKAAVVLSASVTFLSLPGLDAFSRTTGMVAVLFAAFSMAATVVAIFRHKADLERPISHVGIGGMMLITVCV